MKRFFSILLVLTLLCSSLFNDSRGTIQTCEEYGKRDSAEIRRK